MAERPGICGSGRDNGTTTAGSRYRHGQAPGVCRTNELTGIWRGQRLRPLGLRCGSVRESGPSFGRPDFSASRLDESSCLAIR